MSAPKLNLVVAMCNSRGIGIDGKLPWNIRGDMTFFKKITSETRNKALRNAVVMGRKTWESIPSRFRPLPNRLNVVISTTMPSVPEGVHLARSFPEALEKLISSPLQDEVEQTFIIGGSSLYEESLKSPLCHRIYLTTVMADIPCDTFLTEVDMNTYKVIECPDIDSSIQTEGEYKFQIEVLEKRPTDMTTGRPFNILVAFCEGRGISKDGVLPWLPLRKDIDHYYLLSSRTKHPEKKCLNIKGRVCWEATTKEEGSRDLLNLVISTTMSDGEEFVHHVSPSWEDAMKDVCCPPLCDKIDSVWVLGGQSIYETAIHSPLCKRIYITRILADYECDRFFPSFENDEHWKRIRDPDVDDNLHEENGIRFQFEVYERI